MELLKASLVKSLIVLLFRCSLFDSHVLNYDSVTVCDGMAKQIQCPNDENIHVLQGFYGKWRNHDCKGESDAQDNFPTCSMDRKKTTDIAREICQGQNTCKLISDRSIFGEPCAKGKPYLYVTFFCMAQGQKLHHQRTETNEEVVTVPSHGFVVEEIHNVNLNVKEKLSEEQNKKKANLPLENPSPENRKSDGSEILHPTVNKKIDKAKSVVNDKKNVTLAKLINKDKITSELEKLGGSVDLTNNNDNKIKTTPQSKSDTEKSTQQKDNSKNAMKESHLTLKNITKQIAETSPGRKKDEIRDDKNNKKTDSAKKDSSKGLETKALVEGDPVTKSDLPSASGDKKNGSDGKQLRASTICNGQSKLIACLPEEGIKINYAFYGKKSGRDCRGPLPYKDESPSCSALDAKSNVKSSCDGKQTCLLFADDNIYGKSLCPNVNKYLYLTYSCSVLPVKEIETPPAKHVELTPQEDLEEDAVSRSTEPSQQLNTTVKVCNGEKRTIRCNRDTMKILDAFFGKEIGKDCRGELGYRDDIPECKNPRSLEAIKFLCENRKSCELAGESALFGDDVCPGVNKYLLVTYSC